MEERSISTGTIPSQDSTRDDGYRIVVVIVDGDHILGLLASKDYGADTFPTSFARQSFCFHVDGMYTAITLGSGSKLCSTLGGK
jgi:hypothetical protein